MNEQLREQALSLVLALQQHKVDAPMPLVAQLVKVLDALDKAGEQELYKQFQVALLIVAPVDDKEQRPDKFELFAEAFFKELEKTLRKTAA